MSVSCEHFRRTEIVLGGLPALIETGVFSEKAPDAYMVLIPMTDSFTLHGDNTPLVDVQEVRISIYTKGSYMRKQWEEIKQ